MGMANRPEVSELPGGGKFWSNTFSSFSALVYIPLGQPDSAVINYGYKAPYLVVFDDKERDAGCALDYAERSGLADIARRYSTSVVFIRPTAPDGWAGAPDTLFADLAAESKIGQYYRDGIITPKNFFTGEVGESFIRGSLFRTVLFGCGKSADYIARNCLKTLEGQYLWGPGEITPMTCVLENLSVIPAPERRDIPVVSIGNSEQVNEALGSACDFLRVREAADFRADHDEFWCRMKRWCGTLSRDEELHTLNMAEEPVVTELATSPDNRGDDAGTDRHQVGYIAYYPTPLSEEDPLPLVLAFHGGGDSAFHIAWVSGWWRVAMRNRFLLVCLENHLNVSATEVMALIEQLKEKYPIDPSRIYASGFSMGGCKSWDLFQEYPESFAALAPMDATFEVGLNLYGQPAPKPINRDIPVPLYYAAGEKTPLPEMPCQADKCMERARYVFEVNRVAKPYDLVFDNRENWEEPFWGVPGDRIEKIPDLSREAVLTEHHYLSTDGVCRTVFAGVDNQGHECREHTCEQAWQFMKDFTR